MHKEKKEEIMEKLPIYLSGTYISWLVIVELDGKWKASKGAEETKLAVSENYVNNRYWNIQLI